MWGLVIDLFTCVKSESEGYLFVCVIYLGKRVRVIYLCVRSETEGYLHVLNQRLRVIY